MGSGLAASPCSGTTNKVDVLTFGCRLNIHESEVIRRDAAALSDTTVVNTCAVTGEAVRQARQAIRRLRREKPHSRIVVTGCAAQADPQSFAAMPEVDRVVGNEEKLTPQTWQSSAHPERVAVGDIMAAKQIALPPLDAIEGHTRAFVQVQNGCDHRCTFCIIP
ncbi:MAG TPA: tRNA (N(6)-L-threonylcarbamoyladenosine(37)-C(2))-methylthiotransferase MtaB, partial [Xanthobacteraceae bacterium]|nr:tRNA (N(6)-L-threonylcarbamoyladenosine(37)-C(2))-methylthiotransferase MtaB [Xanthobacteraceae bacterium]